jgi:hypothetical protein
MLLASSGSCHARQRIRQGFERASQIHKAEPFPERPFNIKKRLPHRGFAA